MLKVDCCRNTDGLGPRGPLPGPLQERSSPASDGPFLWLASTARLTARVAVCCAASTCWSSGLSKAAAYFQVCMAAMGPVYLQHAAKLCTLHQAMPHARPVIPHCAHRCESCVVRAVAAPAELRQPAPVGDGERSAGLVANISRSESAKRRSLSCCAE